MAELGSINVTDVNRGTRHVDRRSEARGLGAALDLTKKVVDESITAGVTQDMNQAIDEAMDDATQSPLVVEGADTTALRDPREAELRANLDRWKLQAEQGNTSQRTMATIRIKEILNEAQASFPWLTDDLQQRAGSVIAGSAELAELGLLDAAATSRSRQAQGQIDDLQKYASDPWKEDGSGGLGMSPALTVGSDEWITQFMDLDELRSKNQSNIRTIGMALSNREASAIEVEGVARNLLLGKFSAARAANHSTSTRNGFNAALLEVQKGERGNLEVLRQFKDVQVTIIIDELSTQRQQVIAFYDEMIAPRLVGTPSGVRSRSMLDDWLSEVDTKISLFRSSIDELPDAMEQIDTLNKVRSANVIRGLSQPAQNFIAFAGGPGKSLIELAKLSHTADGLITPERLGQVATGILMGKNPDFLGPNATDGNRQIFAWMTSGQGTINPSMSASDINRTLDKQRADAVDPWYVTTTTDKEDMEAAVWSLDNHTKLWNAAISTPDLATPQAAAQYLTGANNSLRAFNGIAEKPEDVSQLIRASLADDSLLEAIDTVGDSVAVVAARRAFGASAKEWYINTRPTQRQADASNAYNTTRISGVSLRDLALVDISSMTNEGEFNYEINTKNFKKAVDIKFSTMQQLDRADQGDFGTRPRQRQQAEEEVRTSIIEAMDPIAREVNESITISRNLDAATAINT